MGNLVSFPLLCLLNKACFDIACDVRSGFPEGRIGRFNGDDCLFCGDSVFFETWVHVTSIFGLVVNKEKTGRSTRFMELNSHVYDSLRHSFVAKPVLSFLRPTSLAPGDILPDLLRGISSFSMRVQKWIVNVVMRYEITLRGPLAGLSQIGPFWRSELVRRRWFRAACLLDAPPVKIVGVNRDLPVVVGPLPDSRCFDFVSRASADLSRDRVNEWCGKRIERPQRITIDRTKLKIWKSKWRSWRAQSVFTWGGTEWRFVWPKELLSFFEDRFPWLLRTRCYNKWTDDHPFLTTRPRFFERRRDLGWRNPAFASRFCKDWPLGYQ